MWHQKKKGSKIYCTCKICQRPKEDEEFGIGCACWCHRERKPLTEEHKEKIRKSKIGNSWNKGRKKSKEACLNISKAKLGSKNPMWTGGIHICRGYVLVKAPKGHPNAMPNGTIREHRLVMEKHIGRYMTKKEVIHHLNENKKDNRIENLLLLNSQSEHMKLHDNLFIRRDHNESPCNE